MNLRCSQSKYYNPCYYKGFFDWVSRDILVVDQLNIVLVLVDWERPFLIYLDKTTTSEV